MRGIKLTTSRCWNLLLDTKLMAHGDDWKREIVQNTLQCWKYNIFLNFWNISWKLLTMLIQNILENNLFYQFQRFLENVKRNCNSKHFLKFKTFFKKHKQFFNSRIVFQKKKIFAKSILFRKNGTISKKQIFSETANKVCIKANIFLICEKNYNRNSFWNL